MTINAELLSLKNDIAAALEQGPDRIRRLHPDVVEYVTKELDSFKMTLRMAFNLGRRNDGHDFGQLPASEIIPDQERLMAEAEAKAWRR